MLSAHHWTPQTSLWCSVWVLKVPSQCSLYTRTGWRPTERPVRTHMKKGSTLRKHRGGTHRDVFIVTLTQDNLMSGVAGDHLTGQVDGPGLRAFRVCSWELIMVSIKLWTTNTVSGLASQMEKECSYTSGWHGFWEVYRCSRLQAAKDDCLRTPVSDAVLQAPQANFSAAFIHVSRNELSCCPFT